MADEVPKKASPDGSAVAIRTIFEDDQPGSVTSWLSVNFQGVATYLTEAQVSDWVDL